jgi:hypothetical protein
MNYLRRKNLALLALALTIALALFTVPAPFSGAADHGDAPANALDRTADIGDSYLSLDPNDNSQVFIAMTTQGFIVPGEAVNFGFFDHNVRYRFELETNGDPIPDHFIDVTFSEKMTSGATPQTATIRSTIFPQFTAPTTVANLSPTAANPVITTDATSSVSFFAGIVDDPFFFDIPAFARFVASVNAGMPDPSQFNRGRDSFAGYNTMAIALRIPVTLLRAAGATTGVGLNSRTARRLPSPPRAGGGLFDLLPNPVVNYANADRAGNPAVNVALIPFPRKNEFNLASTVDDAGGRFAGDIVATLQRFGTNATNIGVLASVAVARGDFLRLSLTTANTGPGGGNNAGAGFPNGRRLGDDVIDTILFFVANQNPLGDNVNSNEVPLRDSFPFFAPPHQPFAPGTTDDRTRN